MSSLTHEQAAMPRKTNDLQAALGQALDASIRATTGGEPGTGLYTLLDLLAGQFMGVPRSAMPMPKRRQHKPRHQSRQCSREAPPARARISRSARQEQNSAA